MNKMVRIEELVLRVPGLSREEARNLGEGVGRHVANALPSQIKLRRLRMLDLEVAIAVGTPEQSAKSITGAILERLA